MKTGTYRLSFVAGALFHQESVRLAGLYLEKANWNEVRDEVISRNLLQARTTSRAKRKMCLMICKRQQKRGRQ